MMGDVRVHKGRLVDQYVREHADQVLTIEQVATALDWSTNSVSGRLGKLVNDFPEYMERLPNRRGSYRWNSKPSTGNMHQPAPTRNLAASMPSEMLVSVVTRDVDSGIVLVRDDATQQLFTLKPFKIR